MKTNRISAILVLIFVSAPMAASESDLNKKRDAWSKHDFSNWRSKPHEKFSNGSATFEKVKKVLLENYVDEGLTEEDLYQAAVQGMLSNIDPSMSAWNRLVSPLEYAELKSDFNGKIVGIGVEVGFNETTGNADVLGIVPGTSADKAGIVRGDQILKIDGQSFRGKQLRDVVYAIRGKPGTSVTLTILHDAQIQSKKLKREELVWDTVHTQMLDSGIGLVTIHYFIGSTPELLKKGLSSLKSKGLKSLIIDLRGNEGGIFERSIESASLLIPKNKLIVTAIKRGRKEEKVMSQSSPEVSDIPIAVLINGTTKSGAEIMAAALKTNAGATTVGSTTFGKWSSQKIEELSNKFAIKYTTANFIAPNGLDLSGKGIDADIPVILPDEEVSKLQNQPDINIRLKGDIQLQAAVNLLKMRS